MELLVPLARHPEEYGSKFVQTKRTKIFSVDTCLEVHFYVELLFLVNEL